MAKNIDKAPDELVEFAKTVFYTFAALVDADVRVEYFTADDVSHNGYPAHAVVKKLPEEQRAAGCADARIIICRTTWDELNEDERRSLIAHELLHLQPILAKPSKDGTCPDKYKRDNLGRPLLNIRKHDFHFGGFTDNIRDFQENSIDLQAIIAVNKMLREKKLIQSQMWG